MRSIADELRELLQHSPLIEEGLAAGILNLSALARQIKPEIEARLLREVSEASLVMALRRLDPSPAADGRGVRLGSFVRDLNVRSGLTALTYARRPSLAGCQARLLDEASALPDAYVNFTSGTVEVTAVVDDNLAERVTRLFAEEQCLNTMRGLAAISVRLTPTTVQAPGVYYNILRLLALNALNTVEVISTFTELSIILEQSSVDRAFSILFRATTGTKAQ